MVGVQLMVEGLVVALLVVQSAALCVLLFREQRRADAQATRIAPDAADIAVLVHELRRLQRRLNVPESTRSPRPVSRPRPFRSH